MRIKEQVNLKDIFLIPNLVTLSRLVLAPVFGILLQYPDRLTSAINLGILFLIGLSDFLDGFLSRQLNQTTPLGKLLDPLADKVAIIISLVALVLIRQFPIEIALAVIIRDVLVFLGGIYIARKHQYVFPSVISGKASTLCFFLYAISFMIDESFIITKIFLILFIILLTISTIHYTIRFFKFSFHSDAKITE